VHNYSEDTLVKQPAKTLFAQLGYETVNSFHEISGKHSTPLETLLSPCQNIHLCWRPLDHL